MKKHKGLLFPVAALACLVSVVPALAQEKYTPAELEQIKDLGKAAIEELVTALPKSFPESEVSRAAVLPVLSSEESDYFTLQIENAFSRHSKKTGLEVYTRSDELLGAALKEIGWSQNFDDAIDAETIQKLGRIRSADAVVYTRVDITRMEDQSFNVRAICQVKETETTRTLWGDEVSKRSSGEIDKELLLKIGKIAGGVLILLLILLWIRSSLKKARRPR